MDPTAALILAIDAIRDDEREDAIDHFENLTAWLRSGGFMPDLDVVLAGDDE